MEDKMNNHIKRLTNEIAERLQAMKELGLGNDGLEATQNRDDAKKIALLREGIVPKYSDLPVGEITGMNNLPEVEMSEFSDLATA